MLTRILCFLGFHHWIVTDEHIASYDDENYEFSKTVTCIRCNRFSVQTELVPKD